MTRCLLLVALASLVPTVAAGQVHTAHDHIPDFCAGATVTSVASGAWSNPSTWSPARVPGGNDVVRVAAGTTVTFDTQMASAAACVGVEGTLLTARTATTRLWTGTMMVYAAGTYEVGSAASPMPAGVVAEVVIANRALDPATDPDQYGTGLIVLGTVRMHGAPRTPAWTRLAAEPRAGQTTLSLSTSGTGWEVGDRVVIPDSRHLTEADRGYTNWRPVQPQWEEVTVQSVSLDGRTVTVAPALRFDHLGARGRAGTVELLPHVGNLTRNVVVHSEVPIGGGGTLGHTMYTARASVDIRYVWFHDLGRTTIAPLDPTTNHIGRYAVHLHHLVGPTTPQATGFQFTFIGNAIDGGSTAHTLKWGMAVHNSHYGLIQGNVFYNWAGTSVMFEDGSESYNVVDSNFALRSSGSGDRLAMGTEGGGFWFRGPNNYVRNNVAANVWSDQTEAAYGFKFFLRYLGSIHVPNFQGADTSVAGQFTVRDGNAMPVLEFANNEVYGAAQGLTYWWIGTEDPLKRPGYAAVTTFLNTRIWAVFNVGVYHYPAANLVFDGLTIRGIGAASACCRQGWFASDYAQHDVTIRHADIFGVAGGITVSTVGYGTQLIEDSVVDAINLSTLYNVNGGSWIPARQVVVRRTSARINKTWDTSRTDPSKYNTTQTDTVLVYAHKGQAAVNFQAYYAAQASQSIAGGLAPCTATHPDVTGIACPISATVLSAPGSLTGSSQGSSVTLNWTAPSAGVVDGYMLEVGSMPGLSNVLQLPLSAQTLGLTGQAPDGTYYIRIRVRDAAGALGPPSSELVLTVGTNAAPPAAPIGLTGSGGTGQLWLSWSPGAAGPMSFVIDAGSYPLASDIASGVQVGSVTSFAASSIPAGTYFIRVRAAANGLLSPPSNEVAITVGTTGRTPPAPPENLRVSVSGRAADIEWSPPKGNTALPVTYVLEAGSAAGLADLAIVPTGAENFLYSSSTPPGVYFLRVRSVNANGTSGASNEVRLEVK